MRSKWLGAFGRSLRDWKALLFPCATFFLAFYPEFRRALGDLLGTDLPEIPRTLLIALALLVVIAFAFWHRVVLLEARLAPKLTIKFDPSDRGYVHIAPTGVGDVLMVRVLPTCETRINNCKGQLVGVYKWKDNSWKETDFNEAYDLKWSLAGPDDPRTRTVHYRVRQYLDVFLVQSSSQQILPCTFGVANRALNVFKGGGIFRFDVHVMGDEYSEASISLRVETTDNWKQPRLEVLH